MLLARIILAVALLGIFVFIFIYNWAVVIKYLITKRHPESWGPLVGGLSGVAGLFLLPVDMPVTVRLLPLILDWGCLPGFVYTGICFLASIRRKEPSEPVPHYDQEEQ